MWANVIRYTTKAKYNNAVWKRLVLLFPNSCFVQLHGRFFTKVLYELVSYENSSCGYLLRTFWCLLNQVFDNKPSVGLTYPHLNGRLQFRSIKRQVETKIFNCGNSRRFRRLSSLTFLSWIPHCNNWKSLECPAMTGTQKVHVTSLPESWGGVPYKHQALTLDDHQMGQGYHCLLWLLFCWAQFVSTAILAHQSQWARRKQCNKER